MRTTSEKAAQALIDAVSTLDFNVHLFIGHIMANHDIRVKRRIVETFIAFLQVYKRNAEHPSLNFRTGGEDPQVSHIDLTDYDHMV